MTATREMLQAAEERGTYYNGESRKHPERECTYWVCNNPAYDPDDYESPEEIIFEWLYPEDATEAYADLYSDDLTDAQIASMEGYAK
jgi:hypothetical protein